LESWIVSQGVVDHFWQQPLNSTVMSLPRTYKAFRRTTGSLPLTVVSSTGTLSTELGPTDVLVKIHAVSLNFRDAAMLHGLYQYLKVEDGGIVASDAAAEVVAAGSGVQNLKIGDHVSPSFFVNLLTDDDGSPSLGGGTSALGGDAPGVLREYAVFDEKVLVRLPAHLSWEEVCG
jgi:NADPH:quinone reductase-like Zn-dependent oxidoreductase